jgi:WD40 repeat protein
LRRALLHPTAPGQDEPHSSYDLYRVNPKTGARRQITSGKEDDQMPSWSPDGKRVAFWRDNRFVCVVNADGSGLRRLLDGRSGYAVGLRWSPDGRELSVLNAGTNELLFINARSGRRRALAGVESWAWSPDGKRLAWTTPQSRVVIADLRNKTRATSNVKARRMAWAGPQVLVVAAESGSGLGLDTFISLDNRGKEVRRWPIRVPRTIATGGGDLEAPADWRSNLLPAAGAPGRFLFEWNASTSSGYEAAFFLGDAANATLKPLAVGQSFALSPDGRSFCWAPYYDLSPYNTPGQRKRVVYTSPLKVSDGRTTRTLISGLVLIGGCDWR